MRRAQPFVHLAFILRLPTLVVVYRAGGPDAWNNLSLLPWNISV